MTGIGSLLYGITHFVEMLFKGKYLKFFIASLVAGAIYLYLHDVLNTWERTGTEELQGAESESYVEIASDWMTTFMRTFLLEGSKFLLLIVLTPFLTVLSQRVDEDMSKQDFGSSFLAVIKQFFRCILIIIVALLAEYLGLALWWLISNILPFGSELDPYVGGAIGAIFIGFTFFDYSLERRDFGITASWRFGKQHWLIFVAVGLLFNLLLMIPYFGVFVAPVILTIVSTAAFVRLQRSEISE